MANLGDTFRDRRIALGLTIDQAEAATRIRGVLIRALEEGDYARLPDPGYVRGYVSSYARFLELDPIPLLQMYRAESGASRSADLNLPQVDVAVAPRHQQHAVPTRAVIVVVVAVVLLSLTVWGVMRVVRPDAETLPEPVPLAEPTSTSPVEEEPAAGAQGDATEETEAAQESEPEALQTVPFTLEVKVSDTGASWLEINVDGKRAYVGTLTGGQSKEYEVTEVAKVLVGRPSAVTILRDGKKQKVPASDDTPTLTLEAETTE